MESLLTIALAAQPGVNPLVSERIVKEIRAFKDRNPDSLVVAFPHWGSNYSWKTEDQTELAKKLIDGGADIVIGHGSHLMQEIEQYKGKWIIYSLGNFVFNAPGRYRQTNAWPYSAVLLLRFLFESNTLRVSFQLYPTVTDNLLTNYQTQPAQEKDFDQIVQFLTNRGRNPGALLTHLKKGRNALGFYLEGAVFRRTFLQ